MVQFRLKFTPIPRICWPQLPSAASRTPGCTRQRRCLVLTCLISATVSGACTPALNWREVRAEGASAVLLFPCKPDASVRRVRLAGLPLEMHMLSCEAQGQVFALGQVQVPPEHAPTVLVAALREAASHNVGRPPHSERTLAIAGLASNQPAKRLRWETVRADGSPLALESAFFAQGGWVYQASIVGAVAEGEPVQMFFSNLRVTP